MQASSSIVEKTVVSHEAMFDPWLLKEGCHTFRQPTANTNHDYQNDSLEKIDASMRDQ